MQLNPSDTVLGRALHFHPRLEILCVVSGHHGHAQTLWTTHGWREACMVTSEERSRSITHVLLASDGGTLANGSSRAAAGGSSHVTTGGILWGQRRPCVVTAGSSRGAHHRTELTRALPGIHQGSCRWELALALPPLEPREPNADLAHREATWRPP